MDNFLAYMKNAGWNIALSDELRSLPDSIMSRYDNIPAEYLRFISRIATCHNSDDTTWFISPAEFAEADPEKWRYNEFELISLDAAEGDQQWCEQIIDFWNWHLPIVMSVGGGYSYYAISLDNGSIVRGFEPEFEETDTVASSFAGFIGMITSGNLEI